MRLEPLIGNTSIIQTPFSTVTLYRMGDGQAVLVDSGDYPRQAFLDLLEQEGLRVRAVICSHLHPDHISNNPALIQRWGTEIFAPALDIAPAQDMFDMIEHSGTNPAWASIRPVYPITPIPPDQTALTIDGTVFPIVQTPGHSYGHVAAITPDKVCVLGDAMMSISLIRQAKLPYMEDADQAIESMERIRQTDCALYVAAHKGVTPREDRDEMVDENIRIELRLYDLFRRVMDKPRSRKDAVDTFMAEAGVLPTQISWYVHHSAETRLASLIRAGELREEDGVIYPGRDAPCQRL